jgi:DNA-binding NtrC family response regulator
MTKILVVDDEIGIRELLREILCDEGYDVVLAENATAARAARQAARPDLVLLDIWMPDTDGVTVLKEWSASGLLTMPVIMMSGHGTIDTAVEAIRFGALDFLEKPIALQKLLSAVKRGLQRQPSKAQSHLTLAAFTRSTPLRDLQKRLEQFSQKSRLLLLRVGPGSLAELCARSLQKPGTQWLDLTNLSQPLEVQALESARGGQAFVEDLSVLNRLQQKNLAFIIERLDKYDLHLLVASTRCSRKAGSRRWCGACSK